MSIKASRVICASLFLFFICLQGCSKSSDKHSTAFDVVPSFVFNGKTMGTQYNIKVLLPSDFTRSKAELQADIDALLVEINQSLSTYITDSEISLLNQHAINEPVKVSDSLFYMLSLSQDISQQSGGAFDVTIGPLVNLWGFGPTKPHGLSPSQVAIENAKSRVSSQLYQLNAKTQSVVKQSDVYIDLSAIAKGYGGDLLAEYFISQSIEHFLIEIGGEIFAKGVKDNGSPWVIGIEKPTLTQTGALQALLVSDVGMATSGDYRNYYERDGMRLSHTIDASTGKPITHNLASVTVIAETAAKADAYATAINVLGPEKGRIFAEKMQLAAYFIVKESEGFSTFYTDSFTPFLVSK